MGENLNLSLDDTLKALVVKAVFDSVPQAKREELLKAAIEKLLTPERDAYSKREKTPLQELFEQAVYGHAREVVSKMLADDPKFKEQLEGVFRDACKKVFEEQREVTVTNMASAITNAFNHMN
jgi:hypothetical protein